MSQTKAQKMKNVPNALTLGRIALIPILMIMIIDVGLDIKSAFNAPGWLLILFILGAASDFLDGYIARKYNLISNFGRMIDPIADKLYVAGCLIALMIVAGPLWYVIVPAVAIIFRDVFISGTREYAALSGVTLSPTKLAKWKTAAEMCAILLLIIGIGTQAVLPICNVIPAITSVVMPAGLGLLWIAAALSWITGAGYIKEALSTSSAAAS